MWKDAAGQGTDRVQKGRTSKNERYRYTARQDRPLECGSHYKLLCLRACIVSGVSTEVWDIHMSSPNALS